MTRDATRPALEAAVGAAGERLVARHGRPGVPLGFEAIHGPVMPGLIEDVERRGHDLLAVGSHGYRGVTRFLLGSVAEEASRHASCSVLVAKA